MVAETLIEHTDNDSIVILRRFNEAVMKVTTPECWGDAMAELVGELREGRPGEGLVLAVEEVGEVLTRHFPKTSADTNEIPDKLIVL